MSLNQRRLLYISFILLFLILTPAVSFYAAGYNLDWRTGAVQRTGIVILETEPREATITIANRFEAEYNWLYGLLYEGQALQTPEKISNLLPGTYEITLTKEGYWPYRREIELAAGQTLVYDDIALFRQAAPRLAADLGEGLASAAAPSGRQLAVVSTSTLYTARFSDGALVTVPLQQPVAVGTEVTVQWSPREDRVAVVTPASAVAYLASGNGAALDIAALVGSVPRSIAWDPSDAGALYALAGGAMYRVSLSDNIASVRIANLAGAHALAVDDGIAVVAITGAEQTALQLHSAGTAEVLKTIFLPRGTYRVQLRDGQLYAHERTQKLLYLVDPWSLLPLQATLPQAERYEINSNEIVYWNRFEVWRYDRANEQRQLVVRLGDTVTDAAAYPHPDYVAYATPQAVHVAELRNGSYRASLPLLEWQNVKRLAVAADGLTAFVVSPYGDGEGLYWLRIR